MSSDKPSNLSSSSGRRAGTQAAIRKPYQKPDFRFERVFEILALSCGKIYTTQAQCKYQPKLS